jgi:hypothetical protein
MEWIATAVFSIVPLLLTGFLLYAVYRVTMDVSAIRALLENAAATERQVRSG